MLIRISILCVLLACLAGLLSACSGRGGENTGPAQLSLSINTTSLPAATLNMPYNQTVAMTASGGASPYQYSCSVSNSAGLSASVNSVDSTTGGASCVISGTPLNSGVVTLNISVSDSMRASASAAPLTVKILSSNPVADSHWRNPLSRDNVLSGVTYGNRTFVAVGDSGAILTSPDGVTWASVNSGTASSLNGVTYGHGAFVAVGDSGTMLTSPDGATWTSVNSGTTVSLKGVTYGNGAFVVVGGYGTILTSTDGTTWTFRTSETIGFSNAAPVRYGAFVAVGDSGAILTSPDGIKWTSGNSGTTSAVVYGVTYGNSIFSRRGALL